MWEELRSHPGKTLEPETGYCAGRCYPVSVEGQIPGAIVLPEVPSYPTDAVELLAPVNLREALKLGDGAAITIALSRQQPEG
jgi:CTP-dependent riboflavin kinase